MSSGAEFRPFPNGNNHLGDFFSQFEKKIPNLNFFIFLFFFRILIQSPHTHKLHGDNLLFSFNLMAIVNVIANLFLNLPKMSLLFV